MFRINDNFCKLAESYLFSEVARRINAFKQSHPDADVIRMGIGEVRHFLATAQNKDIRSFGKLLLKMTTGNGV